MRTTYFSTALASLVVLTLSAAVSAQPAASLRSDTGAQAAGDAAILSSGTTVRATLKSTLDAKHAHVGDSVTAVTRNQVRSGARVLLPKGSRLLGHVTAVEAAGHGRAASELGVVFDHAITPQGDSMPLQAGIAAILSSSMRAGKSMGGPADGDMGMPEPASASGDRGPGLLGGVAGGLNGAVQGAVGGVGQAAAEAVGSVAHGTLAVAGGAAGTAQDSSGNPLSISLPAAGSAAAQHGGLLETRHGNLHLSSGTDLTVVTTASTPVAAAHATSHSRATGEAQVSH